MLVGDKFCCLVDEKKKHHKELTIVNFNQKSQQLKCRKTYCVHDLFIFRISFLHSFHQAEAYTITWWSHCVSL